LRKIVDAAHGEYRNVSESPMEAEGEETAETGAGRGRIIGVVLAAIAFALLFTESLASKMMRHRAIAIGLVAALLLDMPVQLSAQESVDDWAQKGWDAFDQGRYFSATEFYKSAVKLSNGRLDLVYNLACALYKNDHYDEALAEFAKVQAGAGKGSDLELKSRKARADALFWKADDATPGAAEFLLETALSEYREILQIRPDMGDVEFNAGVVERRLDALRRTRSQPDPAAGQAPHGGDDTAVLHASKAAGTPGRGGRRQVVERDW
jgi:tetratricopeptide (TPR) repeat protein